MTVERDHHDDESPDAFDLSSLRAGVGCLHRAARASGVSEDVVDAVIGRAWDPDSGFDASGARGLAEVVDIAFLSNGVEWANLVLLDPAPRRGAYLLRLGQAKRYAQTEFRHLSTADHEAAACDAMFQLRCLTDQDPRVPRWTIWSRVREATRLRALDIARPFSWRPLDVSLLEWFEAGW